MLKDLLMGLLQQKTVPNPIFDNPKPQSDRPRVGQLSDALRRYQNLPMDNMDGTYAGQPVDTAIFGGKTKKWFPPMAPGTFQEVNEPARFDPLKSKDRLPDRFYPILPINPDIMNKYKPMRFMEYVRENP